MITLKEAFQAAIGISLLVLVVGGVNAGVYAIAILSGAVPPLP